MNESIINSGDESDVGAPKLHNGPSARDALLLKCRDAIESLHIEIEEERNEKQRLSEEL